MGAPRHSLVLRACSCCCLWVVIPVSCCGGQSLFVGGWSKWAVVIVHAHFVLLFMGMRDGGSLFFMCGRAHFLSWWAVIICGWLE